MKFKWTSSSLFIFRFLISLIIIGIIVGIIIYSQEPTLIKENIKIELNTLENIIETTKQNNFVYHIILFSVFMLLSLIVIGLPVLIFYFFYEGVSFGFLLASLFNFKGVEGLFFGLIFGIVNKLVVFLSLAYLLLASFKYSKKMYASIKKKDYKIYEYVSSQFIKHIFIFAIILLSDLFIYFFGNKILSYFLFLI